MRTVGLTGGIGMGKSTSADILRRLGVPVIDTDAVAREIVEPGQPALQEIRSRFGDAVTDPAGRLRREVLAEIVFRDATARADLERILHPPIRVRWQEQVREWRERGEPAGVVVIPLLYETEAEPGFDTVVCVSCSSASQMNRLQERGWTAEQIERRQAAQWPAPKKMDLAHHVVWTEGDLRTHEAQWKRLLCAWGLRVPG